MLTGYSNETDKELDKEICQSLIGTTYQCCFGIVEPHQPCRSIICLGHCFFLNATVLKQFSPGLLVELMRRPSARLAVFATNSVIEDSSGKLLLIVIFLDLSFRLRAHGCIL